MRMVGDHNGHNGLVLANASASLSFANHGKIYSRIQSFIYCKVLGGFRLKSFFQIQNMSKQR